jgi:hypothetical protein
VSDIRCEICDRMHRHTDEGRYALHMARDAVESLSFASSQVADVLAHRVWACRDAVCQFRAEHHGVPGKKYPAFLERRVPGPVRFAADLGGAR